MIDKILFSIQSQKISIAEWVSGFVGIIFIRFLLEFFSNKSSYGGSITSDGSTLVHYGLFYISAVFGLTLITWFFSNKKSGIEKLLLFGLPIIWLAPMIDIIFSRGNGLVMTYLLDNGSQIFINFLTFFGPNLDRGATIGIRLEILLILSGIGFYIWKVRKEIFPAIFAIVLSYIFLFSIFSIPGVLYTVSHNIQNHGQLETIKFMERSIVNSNINYNIQDGMISYKSYQVFLEFGFNKLMSQVFFITALFTVSLWFWKNEKEKLKIVIKNSRPERVIFYSTLLTLGALFAFVNGLGYFRSWVDIMSFVILLVSWYGAWMFSVHTNDIADISIDEVSNPERPITNKSLTSENMHQTSYIWLAISLLGSFSIGYYQFFMNLVYVSLFYIYSNPPLRFKRVPIFSSFLLSLACLSTVLSGFFFLSENKDFSIFPILLSVGIVIIFTLGTNIRDMKDIEGDKKEGIQTLPVLFGEKGPKIVGLLFATSFLIVPIIFSFYTLFIISIPTAFWAYKIITKKPYQEKYVFRLYFIFISSTVVLIGGLYLISSYIKI